MTHTPDQEKELQKVAEEYTESRYARCQSTSTFFMQFGLSERVLHFLCAEAGEGFLAGAKHQDLISRKDEREKLITLFQDKLDLVDTYSFSKLGWEILRTVFKQVVDETIK